MIDELHVSNVALIKSASLQFSPHLTVLSGETGSGKSALLSAVKLVVGERADTGEIREGSEDLEVQGRFFVDNPVAPLDDKGAGAAAQPEEGHVVIRSLGRDGRSRISLDGKMATVSSLAQTLGETVDLCGQHEHQKLLQTHYHSVMLDAWIGDEAQDAKRAYHEAYQAWEAKKAELKRLMELSQDKSGELEDARFALRKIDEVAPQEGEFEQLEEQLPKLEHAEALVEAATNAHFMLGESEGALELLNGAIYELGEVAEFDPNLAEIAESLQNYYYEIEDVARELLDYEDTVEFDQELLEQTKERHSELMRLMRAFGPRMEDVFERKRSAEELISAVDDSQAVLERAQKALDGALEELKAAADKLCQIRLTHKDAFAAEVSEVLEHLQMPGAALEVSATELELSKWTSQDPQKVEFLFRPGHNLTARPLVKVASGGEASRVMLAIKAIMGEADDVETLIFDEIDAGVGGSVGQAVGEVLAKLAKTHQVIVVTHLAQIAVFADKHYVVDKQETESIPETTLHEVTGDARVEEIARMLSGDTTEASRKHAQELLHKAVN